MYFMTTLFCTGLVDVSDMASSTMVLVAPSSTPSSLTLSALDIRPLADVVATAVPAFVFSAAVTVLFMIAAVDTGDSVSSTSTSLACASTVSSLRLSAADIRPSDFCVAAALSAFAFQAAIFPAVMPSSTARFLCVCRALVLAAISLTSPGVEAVAPFVRWYHLAYSSSAALKSIMLSA